MSELNVTSTFVKKLTKNIRLKYGKELSHTEVMELVADALGWKAGPLMHALKNSGTQTNAATEELLPPLKSQPVYITVRANDQPLTRDSSKLPKPYSLDRGNRSKKSVIEEIAPYPFDSIAVMIHDALSLERLAVSPRDVVKLRKFGRTPGKLLIVVADRNEQGLRYAASLARDWMALIDGAEIVPYHSGRKTIPFKESLGIPGRRLSHVVRSPGEPVSTGGRFIMVDAVGSPLNMLEGVEASRKQTTILVANRDMVHLLLGLGDEAAVYWAKNEGFADRKAVLDALIERLPTVMDIQAAGRFDRVELLGWDKWVTSQPR